MVERISSLIICKFTLGVALALNNPILECKVDNIKLVIHLTGWYSEKEKLVVDYKRRALFADCVAIDV